MKAIVQTQYGSPDVLQLKEVLKPIPTEHEVLIAVHAAGLNAADWHLIRGKPFLIRLMMSGIFKPKFAIPGTAVAGRVEAVGSAVTRFKVGDAVYGDLSGGHFGALAEYVCVPEEVLVPKPDALTFEEAAALPLSATTALQGLRDKGHLKAGQKVLIYGASGGVGTYMVQLAKAIGAEVTAVCSTGKVPMMRALGADHVIDYTQEDFARTGKRYDLIVAVNGNRSIFDYRRALADGGTYVMVGGALPQMFQAMLLGPWLSRGGRKMGNLMAKASAADLMSLHDQLQSRALIPVLDKCFPLNETADALRYVETGHARGKVVVTVDHR